MVDSCGDNHHIYSLELLELCMSNNILKDDFCLMHFNNKLEALVWNKNFLQIGKLSQSNLHNLLLHFLARERSTAAKTINIILENYFNRKGLRAVEQLQEPELAPLR